jgi:PIN domain nuclease of toxin-antitoxin system
VTSALLLDTHIALWLETGDPRLRPSTRVLLDECWMTGGTIFFSAVSAWEIALLVNGGRLSLDLPVEGWVRRFLDRPGVEAAPLTPFAAARSYPLANLEHRDPGDRLLISSAIEAACPLVTYDARIIGFAQGIGQQSGFTALS